ncbi:MAG: hypothetical protein QOI12_244 [Alphaproteobacteria bacterium]|jgi:tetratricopeptide (TPR) repeat protein/2-polyprenyl-3-methyl-5-hydroxy-6-metoxy-1,4-benzoquinol methylase|nr:hypothetical protein [Alphaproteobacteria bacterium]
MNRKERRAGRKSGPASGSPAGLGSTSFAAQLCALGDEAARAGRFAQAEDLYRQALASAPNDIMALYRLGQLARQSGHHDAALGLFRHAIALDDGIPELHVAMAMANHEAGRLKDAAGHCAKAIRLRRDFAEAHFVHGNVLLDQGDLAEAAACYRRAVAARPDYPEALINLGEALYKLGRADDAIAAWQRAQSSRPHPLAAMNLGIALMQQGQHAEAIEQFKRAVALAPDSDDALTNLAKAQIATGDIRAALETVWRGLALRETQNAKLVFIECLKRFRFTEDMQHFHGTVARAVSEAWARLDEFNRPATALAKQSPPLAACIARVETAWPQRLAGDDFWSGSERAAICGDPLLRALLESAPVCDLELERFLTHVRRALLRDALSSATAAPAPDMLELHCALARQCFINEYVYALGEEEAAQAQHVRQSLVDALAAGAEIAPLALVAAAAYAPLHSLPGAQALLRASWPAAIEALLKQQVEEPLEEARLRAAIPALTPVEDAVSLAVQEQYEQNPYPRWARMHTGIAPDTIEGALRTLFPASAFTPARMAEHCDLLMAGCGSGYESIENALRFTGARVTAVDLSRTSLGYAARKTRELGIETIDYAQADILKLGSLGRSFDVIESGGVLHHLDDPFAGWRALIAILRPGGFMYVGLYSEIGRQHVVAARALIAERGYGRTVGDIRRFRQELVGEAGNRELGELWKSPDFFSTSGCRDLCFHVQEHRLTIPQIKAFIAESGLAFLGFVVDGPTLHRFRSRFPGGADTDFDLWHQYETENPSTFSGMYHLWLQKRGQTAGSD